MILSGASLFRSDFPGLFKAGKAAKAEAKQAKPDEGRSRQADRFAEERAESDAFFWAMYPIY